jgi:uncharacterized membrane protein HdeD (DUF308 family)
MDMEFLKKLRVSAAVGALLTVLMGILFVLYPYGVTSTIAVIAGLVVLCNGILDIVRYLVADHYVSYVRGNLFNGILKCVLGVFILTHSDTIIALFSYIFGIFIIMSGVGCLEGSMQLRKAEVSGWMVNFILAAAVTIAGIVVLFCPVTAASAAAWFVGIVLIVDGIAELFMIYRLKKIGKEFFQSFRDIRDELNGNIIDQ